MRGSTAALLSVLMGYALACAPEVKSDPILTTSAATIAVFQPDTAEPCLSRMPYPVDLVKDPATGKLAIPFCPADSEAQIGIKTGLRTLDGWAVTTAIYTDFSAAIDPATITAGVHVLDLTHGGAVQTQNVFDSALGRLYMLPVTPLREKTRYAVILTNSILDTDGNPPVSDQIFTLLKSTTPLADALGYSTSAAVPDENAGTLESLRLLYDQLFKFVIEPLGITRAETLVSWTFTTQTVESQLTSLATVVKSGAFGDVTLLNASPAATHPLLAAAGLPTANLCRLYSGRISLRNLLNATGSLGPDFATTAVDEPVDYLLTTPKGASTTCATMTVADAWDFSKVVVFVHGLSRCKNDALAIADTLGQLGFATLSVDGVRAGTRTVANLGDQDMDGCPDQGATPELVALAGESPNPFGVRDRIWEWGMEVMQVAKVANTASWSLVGAVAPATVPTTTVAVLGHSWGGMAATLASAVSTDIDMLAVNATSADLTAMFQPLLAAGVAEQLTAAGVNITVNPGKAQYEAMLKETVGAFGWALEPADPRYAVNIFPTVAGGARAMPVLVQVMTTGNQTLQPDAALHAAATQEKLVAAFGNTPVANVTFEFACLNNSVKEPFCDDSTGVVGGMLQPCVEATSADYAIALTKLGKVRAQLAAFLMNPSAAITTPGDAAVDCP
jgi:hypothetical protein